MPLPLPNLDDRRWQDLTQEAMPLLVRYAPQWTDFNSHDPGITAIELFAWLTESLVYRLNQVPDRFRWKFLSLIGYSWRGPKPASTTLSFSSVPTNAPVELPGGVQFEALSASGNPVVFSTARAIDLSPVALSTLQTDNCQGALRDYSTDLADGLPVAAFGTNPAPDAAFYLGFETISSAQPVALWFRFQGSRTGPDELARIIDEALEQAAACKPHVKLLSI